MSCYEYEKVAAGAALPEPTEHPARVAWIKTFDVIVVNTSGGKDSQVTLDEVCNLAREAGVLDRVVAVHCALGVVEWPGTVELARRQAERYGVRFFTVARDRLLLHQVEHERKRWPDLARRYCTSDQKTAQVVKLITRLVRLHPASRYRRVRVLNCLGIRAAESPKRAKLKPCSLDRCSNGRRYVVRWYPVFRWGVEDVWTRIRETGVESHPVYRFMPRLSCSFCIAASKPALMVAARLRPDLAAEYARIEAAIGHTFKRDLSIADVIRDEKTAPERIDVPTWEA